jgi:hypothetical protein
MPQISAPPEFRPKGIARDSLIAFLRFTTVVFLLAVAYGLCLSAYHAADRAGWVEHRAEMEMFFGIDDWSVGEYRNCSTYRDDRKMDCIATPSGRLSQMATHVFPVVFHGRIDRKDQPFFTWKCQRDTGRFTCWALD